MSSNGLSYRGYGHPSQVISHVVWLYHRFSLSLRDVEDVMTERGFWCPTRRYGGGAGSPGRPTRGGAKRRAGRMGDTWRLEEVFVAIKGRRPYLWQAVDQDDDTLDILLQSRRNQRAAERLFCKFLKGEGASPRLPVTDKPASYAAARRATMPSVPHVTARCAKNRGRGLASADACPGTANAGFQVGRANATVSRYARRGRQSVPTW